MNAAIIAVAGIAGAVIGYLLGYMGQKKAAGMWEEKLNETRQKLEEYKTKAASEAESKAAKAKEMEKKLAAAEQKVTELQKDQKAELVKLEKKYKDAEDAKSKLAAQAEANASARQQAEGRLKQAETQAAQAQTKLQQAESQLATAQQEIKKLRSSKGAGPSSEEAKKAFAEVDGSMEGILGKLMELEQLNAAVLADANGLPVVAVGDAGIKDGMAATAQLIGSISAQLEGLIKFDALQAYVLQDGQEHVIAGRRFMTAGEPMGLTTFSKKPPTDGTMDTAMTSLITAIG